MKTLNREKEKKIAQKILKLLDGLPYKVANRIIETVARDALNDAYVELKPLQTYEISLHSEQIEKFANSLENFGKKYLSDEWNEDDGADDDATDGENSD